MRLNTKIFVAGLLFLVSASGFSQGFNQNYEIYSGDANGDGYTDLYIRQTPEIIILHGDIVTPIVIPGPVKEFLLQQSPSNATFSIAESTGVGLSAFQPANIRLNIADINNDRIVDLVLKNVSSVIPNASNQIIYASGEANTLPVGVVAIDKNIEHFFRDLYRMTENPNYINETLVSMVVPAQVYAVVLDLTLCWNVYDFVQACVNAGDILEADLLTPNPVIFEDLLPLLSHPGFFQAVADLLDTLIDDTFVSTPPIYNSIAPNYNDNSIEGCFYYCEEDGGYYYGTYYQYAIYDVFIPTTASVPYFDRENYSTDARDISSTLFSIFIDEVLACGTSDATAFEDTMESVLDTSFMGGVLTSCAVLDGESDFNSQDLPEIRLGKLVTWSRAANNAVNGEEEPSDPAADKQNIDDALEYLDASDTFKDLLEEAEENGFTKEKIVIDRGENVVSGYDPETGVITWNPNEGQIVPEGIQSPSLVLSHEISHYVEHQTNPDFEKNNRRRVIIDPMMPPGQNRSYENSTVEEDRATAVETQIANDLGEPVRENYEDAETNGASVPNPTFSCYAGNAQCDQLIEDAGN